jgi:hypothetical protein
MALASLKWTADTLVAITAVILSVSGFVITTSVHWGTVNAQVAAVTKQQAEQATKIDAITADAADQKAHNARVEQKLDDIAASVDRIEKHEWQKK